MLLVIEMDDYNSPQYGHIHRAGCKHVKDPMPIPGEPDSLGALVTAFHDTTGWSDYDRLEVFGMISPCAKNFKQG
jgi:hypothetical protein